MPPVPWSQQNYIGISLFSGAPNPRVSMPPASIQQLRAQILALPERTAAANYLIPNSWYGGVVVHLVDDQGMRRRFVIHREHVFDSASGLVRLDENRALERQLYNSIPIVPPAMVSELTFAAADAEIDEDNPIVGVAIGEPKPACEGAPTFSVPPPLSAWDTFPGIDDNNCYNYSNNVFSLIDDAQPGRKKWPGAVTESEMHDLLVSDGLVPVGPNRKNLPAQCSTAAGAHLIAVCLRLELGTKVELGTAVPLFTDYHCFRLDERGSGTRWSHKDGRSPATENDNREAGFPLDDLGRGAFKLPQVLVGYYWSVPALRSIGMPS